jgi:hypothetical protein
MTQDELIERLSAPFPPADVEWRVGSRTKDGQKGQALAYIDARAVMTRLDEVCGPQNWQTRYPIAQASSFTYGPGGKNPKDENGRKTEKIILSETLGKTVCEIGIKIDGEWVWKADGSGDTDFEGEKGALSDSFKRAGVKWQIGRYLYNVGADWVHLDQWGKILPHELERLASKLPNAEVGVTVNEPTGLSKKPAKFWAQPLLNILPTLPKALLDPHGDPIWTDPETIHKLHELINKAIDKAPNRLALTKLQVDNLKWISERLSPEDREAIMGNFVIRAEQHDQQVKK